MTPRINSCVGYLNILLRCRLRNYVVSQEIVLTNYRFLFDYLVTIPASAF